MSSQRFTFHRSTDVADGASVFDTATDEFLAGPVDLDLAEVILNAANAADGKLTMTGVPFAVHVVDEVSVRVTADSSLWAGRSSRPPIMCIYCGGRPCEFTTAWCVEGAPESEYPQSLTVALPTDLLQALVGPEIMVGHLEALKGETSYVVDGELNRDVDTALRGLLEWRSLVVEALATAEHSLTTAIASVPTP